MAAKWNDDSDGNHSGTSGCGDIHGSSDGDNDGNICDGSDNINNENFGGGDYGDIHYSGDDINNNDNQ